MNLTEPHCGTDLGLLKTRADPQAGRQLQAHRHQDLHLVGRARPGREHHPPGARQDRRRAGQRQRHLPLHRPQIPRQRRRLAGRTQRRHLRLDRAQDGHPRQFDLRPQLRRRHRLSRRRARERPAGDVHHDERGAPRRRAAGPGAGRGRLSERRRLREGPAAGPRAQARGPRCRSQGRHLVRPSRRPAHADGGQGLQRGRAGADPVGRAAGRFVAQGAGRGRAPERPTTSSRC